MKLFLDPDKTLYTCKEKNCKNCNVCGKIECHFHLSQLIKSLAFGFPIFIVGGIGTFCFSWWFLLIWVAFCLSYFGFVEIRVMCSHCPHYAEPDTKSLKCWVNYGSPKIWKYRPGPMSLSEKIVFYAGLLLIILYPIPLVLLSNNLPVLILYIIAVVVGYYALRHFSCVKCMNFACPLNRVDKATRNSFFNHNPVVSNAWKEKRNG